MSLTARGEHSKVIIPPSPQQNRTGQSVNHHMTTVKTISTGILKRLKDASVADCNLSMVHCTDSGSEGARTFCFQQYPTVSCAPEEVSRSTSETWSMIINSFEQKYTNVYIQSDMKKKAHLDCIEEGSSNLVHEPKEKWCQVLLLDAIVHSALKKIFSPLVESSVRRRKFNQHLEMRNSILEHYGMSTSPDAYDPQQCCDGESSSDTWDNDQIGADQISVSLDSISPRPASYEISPDVTNISHDTWQASSMSLESISEKATKKRKYEESINMMEEVEDVRLCQNMFSLLSDSPQHTFENNRRNAEIVGSSKRRPHPWDSHDNLRNYLLSLSGTGKSSKRFTNVVNDLCRKLATHGTDASTQANTLNHKDGSLMRIVSPRISTNLMDIVALVIGNVIASPKLEYGYAYPPISLPPIPEFNFYNIEVDFIEGDETESGYVDNGCPDTLSNQCEYASSECMRIVEIEKTSDQTDSNNNCNSGAHFVTPVDVSDTSEDDSEHGDLFHHVVYGAQCEDSIKVPPSPFRSSDKYHYSACGDFTFSSFTEMWDENYEI